MHTHAHADNAPFYARVILNARVMASFMCLPMKNPTIYRRNLRGEKNDRLVSVYTSIDYGRGLFWYGDSGFTEEDDDDDDDDDDDE